MNRLGLKPRHRKLWIALACMVTIIFFTALPPRPGYGMSQVRGLVNKIRPGTFPPEMEAGKDAEQEEIESAQPEDRALTDNERQILLSLMDRKRQLDERESLLNQAVEEKRKELVEARRSHRALEILRDKELMRYRETEVRLERAVLDEIANIYHLYHQ